MNKIGFNAAIAISGIVILMSLALYLGYDGALFLTSVGIISGLGGYPILKTLHTAFQAQGDTLSIVAKELNKRTR